MSSGAWRGPAVVLVHEKRTSGELTAKVWVASGGYLLRVSPQHLRAMTNPEFMMYRDSAGGDKTIDDFMKVVDELKKSKYEDFVGQPEPRSEDQERRMLEKRWS